MAERLQQCAPMDQAIILHCQSYRETSLFVDVLTERHGRLRLLCKGARRGRHPLSRSLRPFSRVRLSWTGRGELPVLTAAEPCEPSPSSLEGTGLFCGFYVAELLLKLLALQDAHPEVYRLSLDTLQALERGADLQATLRIFEVALLDEIGYGLLLDEDAKGQPIRADQTYHYRLEEGAVPAAAGKDGIHGSTLMALRQRHFSDQLQLGEAKRLMRGVLKYYLNGRPLKSRELFKPTPKSIQS